MPEVQAVTCHYCNRTDIRSVGGLKLHVRAKHPNTSFEEWGNCRCGAPNQAVIVQEEDETATTFRLIVLCTAQDGPQDWGTK